MPKPDPTDALINALRTLQRAVRTPMDAYWDGLGR